jgi:pimeloyl-ACP methyl ester carboxylesterase
LRVAGKAARDEKGEEAEGFHGRRPAMCAFAGELATPAAWRRGGGRESGGCPWPAKNATLGCPPVSSSSLKNLLVFVLVTGIAVAATPAFRLPTAKELEVFFKPARADQIALAPDGRHLAFTFPDGNWHGIALVDVDRPERKEILSVGIDEVVENSGRRTTLPARVTFLRWASATRLVYAINVPGEGDKLSREEVRAVDADGKNDRKLVDATDLALVWAPLGSTFAEIIPRRPRVLGPKPGEPAFVLVEALPGPNVQSEIFRVNIHTGKFEALGAESLPGRYLYDQQGRARIVETPPIRMPVVLPGVPAALRQGAPLLAVQTYQLRPLAGDRRWQDLDTFLGAGHALAFRASAETFHGQRSFPLAFDADPNVLYCASNVGRDTYGVFALNLESKRRIDLPIEPSAFDAVEPGDALTEQVLVFDRQRRVVGARQGGRHGGTHWFQPELAQLQRTLDGKFGGRNVKILEWDEARTRVLLLVDGDGDPGRYFIFEPGQPGRLRDFLRRAPWLDTAVLNPVTPIAFDSPTGVHLTGTLVLPRHARADPPPLVLYCRDIPGRGVQPGLDREMQALAGMGFAVAQIDYRGVAGRGAPHRDAVKAGFDRVPLEDLRATVAWLVARRAVNPRRVALLGQGFGGFVALRAMQLHPQEFRCAISINAPTDPAKWVNESVGVTAGRTPPGWELEIRRTFFAGDRAQLEAIAVSRDRDFESKPVLVIQDADKRDLRQSQGARLRNAFRGRESQSEYLEVGTDFTRGEPEARAKAFARIAQFLNGNVYDYGVDVGATKEVP